MRIICRLDDPYRLPTELYGARDRLTELGAMLEAAASRYRATVGDDFPTEWPETAQALTRTADGLRAWAQVLSKNLDEMREASL